jgi:hypothetical protein
MKSFIDAPSAFDGMPADVGVLLGRIDVSKGREQLYEDQMPELLQTLSEQSRVESIRASNAIEGIEVEEDRAEKLAGSDQPRPRNRSEKEFAGYRDAIDEMMRADRLELPTVPYLLHLHRVLFQYTEARGGYLETEDNLIASREDGRRRIDFKPPPWQETEVSCARCSTATKRLSPTSRPIPSSSSEHSCWTSSQSTRYSMAMVGQLAY